MSRSEQPKTMAEVMGRMREIYERGRALSLDPTYQKNAEKFRDEYEAREMFHAQEQRLRLLDRRQIPPSLRQDFDCKQVTSSLNRATHFIGQKQSLVLVISGGVGTGKSFAAAWAAAEYPGSDGALWVSSSEIAKAERYDHELRPKLEKVGLLVIDDLGSEYVTQNTYAKSRIWDLTYKRIDWLKRTIITTNLDMPSFRENYGKDGGERFLDRLKKHGKWFTCLERKSMREPSAAERLVQEVGQ